MFSNGNYAVRKFGVSNMTITTALLEKSSTPTGLTCALTFYDENSFLSLAYAYEQTNSAGLGALPQTPVLPAENIPKRGHGSTAIGTT